MTVVTIYLCFIIVFTAFALDENWQYSTKVGNEVGLFREPVLFTLKCYVHSNTLKRLTREDIHVKSSLWRIDFGIGSLQIHHMISVFLNLFSSIGYNYRRKVCLETLLFSFIRTTLFVLRIIPTSIASAMTSGTASTFPRFYYRCLYSHSS